MAARESGWSAGGRRAARESVSANAFTPTGAIRARGNHASRRALARREQPKSGRAASEQQRQQRGARTTRRRGRRLLRRHARRDRPRRDRRGRALRPPRRDRARGGPHDGFAEARRTCAETLREGRTAAATSVPARRPRRQCLDARRRARGRRCPATVGRGGPVPRPRDLLLLALSSHCEVKSRSRT